jgi:hypothetical protein
VVSGAAIFAEMESSGTNLSVAMKGEVAAGIVLRAIM